MSDEVKTKSFWDSKDGTWAMVIGAICILCLVFFPAPIVAGFTVLATTLGFTVAYIIAGLIVLILAHGLFIDGWLMLRYQVFCRNLRRAVIDENPVTILRILKDKAKKRMLEIAKGKGEIKGRVNDCNASLNQSKKEFTEFQRQAKHLSTDPDRQKQFRSVCSQMAIAADLVKEGSEQLVEMQKHYTRLDEAYKDLELMQKEMEYKETALIRKFKNAGALDKVWGLVRGIVKGDTEDDSMREEAIESINEQFAARMGRVESAMDDCQGKFDEIKTKREISENEGVEMFNQLANVSVEQLTLPAPAAPITLNTTSSNYGSIIYK